MGSLTWALRNVPELSAHRFLVARHPLDIAAVLSDRHSISWPELEWADQARAFELLVSQFEA
jgi:hypothetical protein